MLKRLFCFTLAAIVMTLLLCGCAKEAMDDAESAIDGMASDISSGVDSMVGAAESMIPTDPATVAPETDNPTDGEFGEPNVDDYDDNDSDVVGDENEEE